MSEAIQTDSASHNRNISRVQRDEEELKALLKQAGFRQMKQKKKLLKRNP